MAANLVATDVDVTTDPAHDVDIIPCGMGRHVYASLAFGADDDSLTYPANGVPMPAPVYFGMNFPVPYKWVAFMQPVEASANIFWSYDPTVRTGAPYGTLRGIVISSGAEIATNAAVGVTALPVRVTGR